MIVLCIRFTITYSDFIKRKDVYLLLMDSEIKRFNVRVYGLLINEGNEILLSSEQRDDFSFTKFPGGGLELGEGVLACLKREFKEELRINVEAIDHYYTTDFFQRSAFRKNEQIISIYYLIKSDEVHKVKDGMEAYDVKDGDKHHLHWEKINDLSTKELTFPIDQFVLKRLKVDFNS